MDIYLRMAWRDVRLKHNFPRSILVKEESILESIWKPDPYFANAKEATFHDVTFLNFLMRIFNNGEVLYEIRIRLKPSCNLLLCKYPHDHQRCELIIRSFAYPADFVKFVWFSDKEDAVYKNPDIQLPQLYIADYFPQYCDGYRKTGNFSCLKTVFLLKRDVGYHVAQTYVPTSLAVMFSWVGVWLPREHMEGRIALPVTVLLTLSTSSAGARANLPTVSYVTVLDMWFGVTSAFVFITLIQTLFVIGFQRRAATLLKDDRRARYKISNACDEELVKAARRIHKIGHISDIWCRILYPVLFAVFLLLYFFVIIEGEQDDCIASR